MNSKGLWRYVNHINYLREKLKVVVYIKIKKYFYFPSSIIFISHFFALLVLVSIKESRYYNGFLTTDMP